MEEKTPIQAYATWAFDGSSCDHTIWFESFIFFLVFFYYALEYLILCVTEI